MSVRMSDSHHSTVLGRLLSCVPSVSQSCACLKSWQATLGATCFEDAETQNYTSNTGHGVTTLLTIQRVWSGRCNGYHKSARHPGYAPLAMAPPMSLLSQSMHPRPGGMHMGQVF